MNLIKGQKHFFFKYTTASFLMWDVKHRAAWKSLSLLNLCFVDYEFIFCASYRLTRTTYSNISILPFPLWSVSYIPYITPSPFVTNDYSQTSHISVSIMRSLFGHHFVGKFINFFHIPGSGRIKTCALRIMCHVPCVIMQDHIFKHLHFAIPPVVSHLCYNVQSPQKTKCATSDTFLFLFGNNAIYNTYNNTEKNYILAQITAIL